MPDSRLVIIVLAAGKGTRMRSDLPKVMHKLAERPILSHVLDTCEALSPQGIVVVAGPGMRSVEAAAAPHRVAIQDEPRGTGHAVAAAGEALAAGGFDDVLVVYGDTPLITAETLRRLVAERRLTGAAVAVLGMRVEVPNAYGRLVLDAVGNLVRIVETADADEAERRITLCNSGIMAIDGRALAGLIGRLSDANARGEFYLTDLVGLATADGRTARAVEAPADELIGINSRAELAAAEAIVQGRLRARALEGGATLTDPSSVFLCSDTRIGRDVVIGPHVVLGSGVIIEDGVEIKPFCHIEGTTIRRGAIVGPFARLRPGTEVGEDAHIGNFVELKNTRLGRGAKANHLSYLGDAEIGAGSNIGAGTITCNYDGFFKYRTVIGAEVFVGSDTALVAPVTIGDRAMIAAGSVVTRDVAADATAIARGEQVDKPGHAARFRERRRQEKVAASAKRED